MGWCSATVIFDKIAKYVLEHDPDSEESYQLLLALASALFDMDWDCEEDSVYWDHPLVQRVMNAL